MYAERHAVAIAVDASGDFTGYTPVVSGQVVQVRYIPDGTTPLDTGADLTVSGADSGIPVLTKANIGTSAFNLAPRQPTHLNTDGSAALYAAGGSAVLAPVVVANERIKVVVAQGGNAKLGTLHIWVA